MRQDESDKENGFLPIGYHLPKILPSHPTSDSTGKPSPSNSETTGSPPQVPKLPKLTGTQPGGTGVVVRPSDLEQALVASNPDETDQVLLALLPPSVARSLESRIRESVNRYYGFETEFVGYSLPANLPPEEIREARAVVERACIPAQAREIMAELARMRLIVKVRAEQEQDLAAIAVIFAEEMAEYPPDIVRHALRGWTKREKWWPSWAELKELLDRAFKRRKALREVLRRDFGPPPSER